jgi:hypothetical protein
MIHTGLSFFENKCKVCKLFLKHATFVKTYLLKMTVFWDVDVTDVSGVLTASVIRAMSLCSDNAESGGQCLGLVEEGKTRNRVTCLSQFEVL